MAFQYVWEKTHNAVGSLATMDAPLAERLTAAYLSGLLRLEGERDWGTDDIERAWTEIMDAVLTPKGEPQQIGETIAEMDEVQQAELAEAVLSMYMAVEREHGRRWPDR